ncbi:MAG: lipoate--protein ligase family protein [Chitinispirillaceae bacterium]|nr:lipoate--protein ligase family protein [Chitinispirillaceae bacterium]
MITTPQLPGHIRKNDALFVYGASRKKPFVYTYLQDHVEVVGGPSCKSGVEIFTGRCENDGIPIRDRRGGGGTVVLAPGMVITIIVDDRPEGVSATGIFNMIHNCMIGLLQGRGIGNVERSGISDLSINERKILGSSLYMGTRPFLYYYQSSLMVSPDLSLMDRYLRYPPREPQYRRGRSHRDFCTSLVEMEYGVTPEEIRDLFEADLPRCISVAKEDSSSG